MKKIVFATGNPNKLTEVHQLLYGRFELLSLADIGCTVELPETSGTIAGNALQKARYIHENFKVDCFAEDTGLEIVALSGEPGVHSARYAGPGRSDRKNMELVLEKLREHKDRSARFRTVIALILDCREYTFEGIVPGTIRQAPSGSGGFGYDPVFQPNGFDITFAEMTAPVKNTISHRGKAVQQLIDFLRSLSS